MINFEAIRRQHPLAEVVSHHVPLKRVGSEWMGLCPFHDEHSPSFSIFADGQRFHCFGCNATGDVIDFVAAIEGIGLSDAVSRLGRSAAVFIHPAVRRAEPAEQTISHGNPVNIERARAIWNQATPAIGTLAATYLAGRAITAQIPPSIRFAVLAAGRGHTGPALVASIAAVSGDVIGVQRTFLASDGNGKASIDQPKLSLGSIRGGAIHCEEPADTLIIAEGLEDALSAQMIFGIPAWAAAGAGMMGKIALPDHVRTVLIAADNDATGERAAFAAAAAYSLQGRSIRILRPSDRHKDFNNELKEAGA